MGTLPPNMVVDGGEKTPAPRMLELSCQPKLGLTFYNADYGGAGPPLPGAGGFTYRSDTNNLNPWDQVRYDYEGSVARGNGVSGSGPYLRGEPSTGLVYVTAPYDRPVPCFSTFTGAFYHGNINVLEIMGVTLVRAKAGYPLVDYRVLCGGVGRPGNLVTGGGGSTTWERHFSLFAMDIVPPGQTYTYHVGWYATPLGAYPVGAMFNLMTPQTINSTFRPTFSVMTL